MFRACGRARSTLKRLSTARQPSFPSTDRNTHRKQSEKPMNLAETLQQKLSEWRPAGEDRPSTIVELPDHGWSVRFAATKVDTLGCALAEIEAVRATSIADDAAALEAH